MRIANYLRPDCVALRQRADSLTGAVQQMVTLLDGTDNLTDTAVFASGSSTWSHLFRKTTI